MITEELAKMRPRPDSTRPHSMEIWSLRLRSASVPRTVTVDVDTRMTKRGLRWLAKGSGTVEVDLSTWWRADAEPAITGHVRLSMFHGAGTVAVAPTPDGHWQVTVDVTVRGRGVLRPLASLGILLGRPWLRHEFQQSLDKFGRQWNQEMPLLLARSTDELRALIAAELTKAPTT